MRHLVLIVVLVGLWMPHAEAGSLKEALHTTGDFAAQGVVVLDKILHWSWDTLHQYVVHPVAEVVTLGTVDLDQSS